MLSPEAKLGCNRQRWALSVSSETYERNHRIMHTFYITRWISIDLDSLLVIIKANDENSLWCHMLALCHSDLRFWIWYPPSYLKIQRVDFERLVWNVTQFRALQICQTAHTSRSRYSNLQGWSKNIILVFITMIAEGKVCCLYNPRSTKKRKVAIVVGMTIAPIYRPWGTVVELLKTKWVSV